ncbi:MAG: hypothetical protein K8R59_01705 [Thermoanaerobaculales bacterium]|nr:hypothetical protein [Thermoanaerobaculales bacterium]
MRKTLTTFPVLLVAVALLTAAPFSRLAAADPLVDGAPSLEGLPILRIEFNRGDIFDTGDSATSAWPYRWANALNIVTKESFLRSMLLFQEGDAWSQEVAAESARILRSLSFLNPVFIKAEREASGVVVTVDTHDQWTLQAGAKFGIQGDRKAFSIEFEEKNFLGRGRGVRIKYQSDHERRTWIYTFSDPNILGTRWRGRVLFADASDGHREELLAERPFYSLETSQAWGGEWKHWKQVEHLYSGGESIVQGHRDYRKMFLRWGKRINTAGPNVHRISLAYHLDERIFSDWHWTGAGAVFPDPADRAISGPRVEYEIQPTHFEVLHGFRTWSAQEDQAFGTSLTAGLTLSLPEFGGDVQRLVLDSAWDYSHRAGDWLVLSKLWLNGRSDEGKVANLVGGFQIALSQLGPKGWQFRLFAEDSSNLDRERQLTLGADFGLRGWDPDTFDGTGRAVANLQWRTLVKEDFLHLFSLGVVLFVDAGATWNPRVGFDTDGVRFDAGIGLLADLTHIGLANLLRVDLAFPDDGSGITVIVTSSALF